MGGGAAVATGRSGATNPRIGGRPTQELAGDQPEDWRAPTREPGPPPRRGRGGGGEGGVWRLQGMQRARPPPPALEGAARALKPCPRWGLAGARASRLLTVSALVHHHYHFCSCCYFFYCYS